MACDCHGKICRLAWYWFAAITVFLLSIYIIVVQIIFKRAFVATVYFNSINQVGYWIHIPTGLLYFLFGFLQFSQRLRHSFPKVHRCIGYAYYALALLSTFGIVLICIGGAMAAESMVLATVVGWPLWMFWMYQSWLAIRMGDIQRHRDMNWRAFMFALAIVTMRPVTAAIVIVCRLTLGEALKTAVWLSWVGTIVVAEVCPPPPFSHASPSSVFNYFFLCFIRAHAAFHTS
jgi:hypothetical protein